MGQRWHAEEWRQGAQQQDAQLETGTRSTCAAVDSGTHVAARHRHSTRMPQHQTPNTVPKRHQLCFAVCCLRPHHFSCSMVACISPPQRQSEQHADGIGRRLEHRSGTGMSSTADMLTSNKTPQVPPASLAACVLVARLSAKSRSRSGRRSSTGSGLAAHPLCRSVAQRLLLLLGLLRRTSCL